MTPISIELAESEHLSAIPAIELAASALFPEVDVPLENRYCVTEDELLREAQSDARLWVALTGDRIPVGFAMADFVDGGAHLDQMDVIPDFGRQGIGTHLVRTLIDWARSGDYPVITLITFRHLPWNAPFYEKLGFEAMASSELGAELAGLLKAEGEAGIDVRRRICMQLDLTQAGK
ncbi:MAG: GNAT family N-acetyltransferase [Proteobacteria bacterium]|nr:GNAT family N-acetyltransferase [Pseudomonadota bacterium]TDJ36826.1 MAG: GNAT family N-acetyltransferase [Gammaproteobacteria bacterium]